MILIATLFVYFLASLIVGLWGFRKTNYHTYTTNSNQTTPLFLTCSLLGTTVGGGMFLGVSQLAYSSPISAFAIGLVYCVGGIVLGVCSPYMRRKLDEHEAENFFDLLDKCYPREGNCRYIPAMFNFVTLLVFALMLSVQYASIASYLSFYLQINHHVAVVTVSAVLGVLTIAAYSITGGFRRDILTDVFQMIVITVGVVLLVWGFLQRSHNVSDISPDVLRVGSKDIVLLTGAMVLLMPTFFVRYDLWQRVRTAKSDQGARIAFILAGMLSMLFFAAFAFAGLFAKTHGVNDELYAGLHAIEHLNRSPVYGVVMVAFFAAVISSADTFLGVTGLTAHRLMMRWLYPNSWSTDERIKLRRIRLVTFVMGALALLIALLIRDIVDLLTSAFGLLSVFLPSIAYAVFRANPLRSKDAGFFSIVFGLASCALCVFVAPKLAFVLPFVVSLVVFGGENLVHQLAHRHRHGYHAAEPKRPGAEVPDGRQSTSADHEQQA